MLTTRQRLALSVTLSITAIALWATASYLRGHVIWWL